MAPIQRSSIFIFHGFIRPRKGSEILSPNSPLRFRCRCRGRARRALAGQQARPGRAELYMGLCTATPTISTTTTTTADDHEDRTHDIDSEHHTLPSLAQLILTLRPFRPISCPPPVAKTSQLHVYVTVCPVVRNCLCSVHLHCSPIWALVVSLNCPRLPLTSMLTV